MENNNGFTFEPLDELEGVVARGGVSSDTDSTYEPEDYQEPEVEELYGEEEEDGTSLSGLFRKAKAFILDLFAKDTDGDDEENEDTEDEDDTVGAPPEDVPSPAPAEEEEPAMVPEEFIAEFNQALVSSGKAEVKEEAAPPAETSVYRASDDKDEEEKPARPARRKAKGGKYLVRRIVALVILAALLLALIGSVVAPAVRKLFRGKTENLGPLPHEDVTVIPVPLYFDFTLPVPASPAAESSFFSDALFVGDNHTSGLSVFTHRIYAGNITVYDALDYDCETPEGNSTTLRRELSTGSYGKVYLCFGLNEWGYSAASFRSAYEELVQDIMALCAGAKIYIVGLPPVPSSLDSGVNNSKIDEYNTIAAGLAAKYSLFYIDSSEAMAGADGSLKAEYSGGYIYLTSGGFTAWSGYIKTHTVDPEIYANIE